MQFKVKDGNVVEDLQPGLSQSTCNGLELEGMFMDEFPVLKVQRRKVVQEQEPFQRRAF